ncbi:alpha/beta-hydrolase [Halteromyces radiatus]|uniref:alpha/beta-hydrolase n=1 Tax=Halteromyces radiatus TaxID=101107 RepID=UPI00221F1F3F|nr:alpha/beta-hydrolase [Halteromyces radiatus]KAI8098481.1 alpha/beta-hydrolase [Halteromyces radiatus]
MSFSSFFYLPLLPFIFLLLLSLISIYDKLILADQTVVTTSFIQTLSLKRLYHYHSNSLHRYRRRPSKVLQQNINDTFYTMKQTLDYYSKPSKESLNYFLQRRISRWQVVPSTHITMESTWGFVPDVTDHATVLSMAKMSYDAYSVVGGSDWYDLDNQWVVNDTFGWNEDGLKGHVFGNTDNSLMVIVIKGTTAGLFTNDPTGEKDKLNDNMLFSCCCARISRLWTPVCDCYQGNEYRCENSCIEKAILNEELYYDHALAVYRDISDQYPEATIFMTGHSLGGALAALVGQTYGVPAVSFESPGDRLAARRLHLPQAPGSRTPIFHFGHTADPIFIGLCTGISSSCWYGGFAMETRCHTGKACVWDTVNEHGWKVDIRSHRIGDVIEKILNKPEEFPLPRCLPERDCVDCGLWDFIDDRDSPGIYRNKSSNSCNI